jgi:hypothetical protein
LQDPPKFTQILIFGLKTNHLATLNILDGTLFLGRAGEKILEVLISPTLY